MRAILAQVLAAALLAWSGACFAQDATLIEAAKKEGAVTWYTTLLAQQFAEPASVAFQRKYGFKPTVVSLPVDIALRISNEANGGQYFVDVFDGTNTVAALRRWDLTLKWQPEIARTFPRELADPEGYWTAVNLYPQTMGFNTDLVPKGTEPKSTQDLLDPRWRGRIAWSRNRTLSAGPGFVGAVLTSMGEQKGMEFLAALSKQNVVSIGSGARQVLDLVVSGEHPIALQIFNYHAVISAAKGAPVAWGHVAPSTVSASSVSVAKRAPHPNAAKLLAEFLVSTEGQALFRDADYVPANPAVAPRDPRLRPGARRVRRGLHAA
jgi:ABC-type Fe3+ transport system substrate-binding protein